MAFFYGLDVCVVNSSDGIDVNIVLLVNTVPISDDMGISASGGAKGNAQ
jgi:hypothetical protein